MNIMTWAERELEAAGYRADDTEDGPNRWMREGTLALLDVFSKQGHSGMSAPYAVNWVATMSGMFFPLFVGFLLGQHLHTVKVKETDT